MDRATPEFRLEPLDPVEVAEVEALGYQIEFGTHNFEVRFRGGVAVAAGIGHHLPGDPQAMFDRAIEVCRYGIDHKWGQR